MHIIMHPEDLHSAKIWRIPPELSIPAFSEFIPRVRNVLDQQGVIIFPTDTVYGIGCLPNCSRAVEKVIRVKHRNQDKGLPLLAGSIGAVERVSIITSEIKVVMKDAWPGPTTLLLKPRDSGIGRFSPLILGGHSTIAVRIPGLPILQRMIQETGGLWVGTSANISQQDPVNSPIELFTLFKDKVDGIIILDNSFEKSLISKVPSKIMDMTCNPPRVLRG